MPRLYLPSLPLILFSLLPVLAQTQADSVRQAAEQSTDAHASPAIHHATKMNQWQGSLSAGVQISRGATNVNGISVQGATHHNLPKRSVRIDWNVQFAEARVPGEQDRVVAQDRQTLHATLTQPLKGRFSIMSQLSGEHDRQHGLSYRATLLNGIGMDLAKSKRFHFTLAPGFGITREHKNYVENGWLFRPGFYEGMTFVINEHWMFHETALYRIDSHDPSDSAFDGIAQLSGMINKRFGVQFTYNYNYEGKVGPGLFRSLSQLTAGIKVSI